jgi:hypothetical protein
MPAGRPTEYLPEYAERAKILCDSGATNLDLAHEFGVTLQTLRNWRAKYPEFLASLKLGKEIADAEVERSLYERATGYSFGAVKQQYDAKAGKWVEINYIEHVPPDPTAMIFWLKNRKPKEWRDKQELEVSGNLAEMIAAARKRNDK